MASRKTQPLVSVVTPVYNTEKYLAECIESVLNQTYENWEYVIVNNCSTDRSLEIAEHYAQQDTRISIHNNEEFLNLMQNWNHSMRQISPESKYCKVVHADDWLFPDCLARMVEVAESHPSIGIVSSYRLDENRVNLDGLSYPSTVVRGREICRLYLLENIYVFGSPSSHLLRSDLIRNRKSFYNESNIHADLEICFEILQESDFGFVHQVLTFTRRHNETHTMFSKRYKTYILGMLTVLIKYGSHYLNTQEYCKILDKKLNTYHRIFVKGLLQSRSIDYIRYHKNSLKRLGQKLSFLKTVEALSLELLDIKKVYNKIQRIQKRNQPHFK